MKEIIQEIRKSRLKPEMVWFIDFIKDIKIKEQDTYPEIILWEKDGEIVFEQDFDNHILWCSFDKIWSILEWDYSLYYIEIQKLIINTMEDRLNISGFTPRFRNIFQK
jgi:hypothetical protein